jgi:hypothetical protein
MKQCLSSMNIFVPALPRVLHVSDMLCSAGSRFSVRSDIYESGFPLLNEVLRYYFILRFIERIEIERQKIRSNKFLIINILISFIY